MTELFENIQKPETAVLVGVDMGEYDCEASLDELEELTKTAGAEVKARVTQRRETPDSATFVGSGRLKEIKTFCADNDVDLLIFDSELTPSQQRNIEDITDVRVVDRTQLILDIFAARARSGEGKLQVELAQLKYLSRGSVARARVCRAWAEESAREDRAKQSSSPTAATSAAG